MSRTALLTTLLSALMPMLMPILLSQILLSQILLSQSSVEAFAPSSLSVHSTVPDLVARGSPSTSTSRTSTSTSRTSTSTSSTSTLIRRRRDHVPVGPFTSSSSCSSLYTASSSPRSPSVSHSHSPPNHHSSSLFSTLPNNPTASQDEELLEHLEDMAPVQLAKNSTVEHILSSYWGPRVILAVLAAVYATNFPLGALMNDHLPASAATCARMVVAAVALSPFLLHLHKDLRLPAVLCGLCTASGYVTQSLALENVDPAKVSFLGSATVLWCPLLEWAIEHKPMGIRDSPQTWLAALMSLGGVGVLELYDAAAAATDSGSGTSSSTAAGLWDALTTTNMGGGDALALLQAVGFGTGVFWTSRMLRKEPDQALPVTATLIATTAAVSSIWCLLDGWMFGSNGADDWFQYTLPGMMMEPDLRQVALAVLWTGLISTSLNFFIELTALGRVPPSEASVILASEPLWAAIFASLLYHTSLTTSDWIGGGMLIGACLVNALVTPELLGIKKKPTESEK